ncbi:MAG: hypothetical protein IT336_02230 [Thermomicrobiales bacterium]|nr:hypothetical protein [Thermomicrobiales bacterium]
MDPIMMSTRWIVLREIHGASEARAQMRRLWLRQWGLTDTPTPPSPEPRDRYAALRALANTATHTTRMLLRTRRPAPAPQG